MKTAKYKVPFRPSTISYGNNRYSLTLIFGHQDSSCGRKAAFHNYQTVLYHCKNMAIYVPFRTFV